MVADVAEQWLDDWQARISDKAAQAREFVARVGGLRRTAESRDGAVRVTVDSTGVPIEIELGDAVSGWRPQRISAEILATMRRAQVRLAEAMTEAAQATVGIDSETGRAVVASYLDRLPTVRADDATDRDRS